MEARVDPFPGRKAMSRPLGLEARSSGQDVVKVHRLRILAPRVVGQQPTPQVGFEFLGRLAHGGLRDERGRNEISDERVQRPDVRRRELILSKAHSCFKQDSYREMVRKAVWVVITSWPSVASG